MTKNKLPTSDKPVKVTIVSNSTTSNACPMPKENDKWKVEDALRTLEQAESYKKDKDLMKDVKQLAKNKIKCLSNIK